MCNLHKIMQREQNNIYSSVRFNADIYSMPKIFQKPFKKTVEPSLMMMFNTQISSTSMSVPVIWSCTFYQQTDKVHTAQIKWNIYTTNHNLSHVIHGG